VTPILNVSELGATFEWFEKLGWQKTFEWGTPPDFGGVRSGEFDIHLCVGAQGGRGRSSHVETSGFEGADAADRGVWIAIVVDDVDAIHRACLAEGLEVTWPPTDEPWGLREMHVRHPDGHVLRIAQHLEQE
jgi:hypothetical protein